MSQTVPLSKDAVASVTRAGANASALRVKADWIRLRTMQIHRVAPGIRIASALSAVEITAALFYTPGLCRQNPTDPRDPARDRFIASKGHGSLCVYPALADLGFFPLEELDNVGKEGSFLGVIPEPITPGIETTNGSLGHGPGVACGIAVALKCLRNPATVYVLCGDGEMNAGAVWEAFMFAAHNKLDNLVVIVDDNGRSMLGFQKDIMGLAPLAPRFAAFGWAVEDVDGHNADAVSAALVRSKALVDGRPKVVIAHTIKGHGVAELEDDPLAHIRVLSPETIDATLANWS
jgi:transketolase